MHEVQNVVLNKKQDDDNVQKSIIVLIDHRHELLNLIYCNIAFINPSIAQILLFCCIFTEQVHINVFRIYHQLIPGLTKTNLKDEL
jgi:hypothetical protein